MGITRRDAIRLGLIGAGALAFPVSRLATATTQNRIAASLLPRPYTVPFTVPNMLRPVRSTTTTDLFQLSMRAGTAEILPGYQTALFGYGGTFPGPTIEVERGREAVIRFTNELTEPHPSLGHQPITSVHLHGSASLPSYDGYANDLTPPGSYKDYRFPNIQDARTLWYHDHGVHHTSVNVYSGLAGVYIMHDAVERSLPIPQGRYDVPLVVSDAMFTPDGQLMWIDDQRAGMFGDVILVNGRPWPVMQVERRKYRFRILNASISRAYRWRLDSGDPFTIIGTDGGLMPFPQKVNEFRHGNAERYEVVIDFAKYPVGRRVQLLNRSNKNEVDYPDTGKVMAFDVVGNATSLDHNSVPDVLNPAAPTMTLDVATSTATRRLDLIRTHGHWTINGTTWHDVEQSGFTKVLANPKLGAVEIWEIRNPSGGWHHPFHIHLIDFRIIDRSKIVDGKPSNPRPPMPHERGPKDVVFVGENEAIRVLAQFGPHPGKYMMHCHNLVHEDHDMMAQFEVGSGGIDPLSVPSAPLPAPEL